MSSRTTLKLADLTKGGHKGLTISADSDHIILHCVKPIIVQPSEIQKIRIDVGCEVPYGHVLQISTYPKLAEQAAEIFPALTVIDNNYEGELTLAVRNHGRNPLNLMPGTPIAVGHVIKIELLNIEGFEYSSPKPEQSASKPQKKNPFNFEVK